MSRALVIGGAGLVGSHTVDLLLERGHSVRVLDSLEPSVHPGGRPRWLPDDAEFFEGSASNDRDLCSALEGMEMVFELSNRLHEGLDISEIAQTLTAPVRSLFRIISDERKRYPVSRLLLASRAGPRGEGKYGCLVDGLEFVPEVRAIKSLESASWDHYCPECGAKLCPLPTKENECRPQTPYGFAASKLESLAKKLGAKHGVSVAAMRYAPVQGSRQSIHDAFTGIARRFALQIALGRNPVCYEDGEQQWQFVNAKDVAAANLVAVETNAEWQVLNVAGPTSMTVVEFAGRMCDISQTVKRPEIGRVFRQGDPRSMLLDTYRLRRLGWQPERSVDDSIKEYLAWLNDEQTSADGALRKTERDQIASGTISLVSET